MSTAEDGGTMLVSKRLIHCMDFTANSVTCCRMLILWLVVGVCTAIPFFQSLPYLYSLFVLRHSYL